LRSRWGLHLCTGTVNRDRPCAEARARVRHGACPSLISVAAVLLVSAATAWGATATGFATGKYRGKSDQGLKVSFRAGKQQVTGFAFKETGTCSNGQKSNGTQGPFTMTIDAKGRFSASGASPSGATRSRIIGKLSGKQASGTFRIDTRFDASGNPDPNGTVRCTSGKVHWTATKRR
jgi:hypothetical protein